MEFPRYVYKDGGKQVRAGGTYSSELAQDEAEHEALLSDGWSPSLAEALEAKPADQAPANDDQGPASRDEMVQKLEQLGVVFDRRLGDKKLAALLDESLKKA